MATDYRTHHADCYLTHHECAIAEIERLRRSIAALEEATGGDPGPKPTESPVRCISAIAVELVQQVGSDATIAAAARVSTLGQRSHQANDDADAGLIRYLMRHRHGSPFEHGSLTVRVHAPVKVFREWHRHRAGWAYSEESGRYRALEPLFYIPHPDRPMIRCAGFKSADPTFGPADPDTYSSIINELMAGYTESYRRYETLLSLGVDRGLARDVLGVGIYSSCYCTANPRAIMHFLELRTQRGNAKRPSKPIYEIAVAAEKLEAIFAKLWPTTWAAWNEGGRMAP